MYYRLLHMEKQKAEAEFMITPPFGRKRPTVGKVHGYPIMFKTVSIRTDIIMG